MKITEIIKREPVDQNLPFDSEAEKVRNQERLIRDPSLGPHEGRYLTLMVRGKKPAVIIPADELEPFMKYIQKDIFSIGEIHSNDPTDRYIITHKGEEWRIAKLNKLYSQYKMYEKANKIPLWHSKIGIILGYSNEDIRKFIAPDPFMAQKEFDQI